MPLLQLGAGGPCTCRAVVMLCAPLVKHCPSTITLRYYAGGLLPGGAEKRNTERWGGMPCWIRWLRCARKAKSLGGLAVRQRYVSVSQQPFKPSRNPGRPQFVCIVRLRHVEDVESSHPRMPAICCSVLTWNIPSNVIISDCRYRPRCNPLSRPGPE